MGTRRVLAGRCRLLEQQFPGELNGRRPNMLSKQREMDEIIKLMYGSMKSKDHLKSTLLVLAGDHGMNEV